MTSPIPEQSDIAVIGGGIIGLAVAFELSRRGKRVLVLERDLVGRAATWASAGMLASVSEAEGEEAPLLDLAAETQRLYPDFIAAVEKASGLSCGYRREGTLFLALGRDDELDLDHLRAAQAARGLVSHHLTAEEVFAKEPQVSGWVTGGLFAPDDHQVDPRSFALALAEGTRNLGGTIIENAAVTGLDVQAGRVRGMTVNSAGHDVAVRCDAAVLAAGAWSTVEFPALETASRVRPVKGHTVRVRGPRLISHVIRTPEVYIVPRANGEIVIGATSEEKGFDPTPQAGAVMDLLRRAWRALPGIYDLEFVEVATGFRPMTRSHLPMLGALRQDGAFIATGHGRHGVFLAPVTAMLMADLIVDGKTQDLLTHFLPLPRLAEKA